MARNELPGLGVSLLWENIVHWHLQAWNPIQSRFPWKPRARLGELLGSLGNDGDRTNRQKVHRNASNEAGIEVVVYVAFPSSNNMLWNSRTSFKILPAQSDQSAPSMGELHVQVLSPVACRDAWQVNVGLRQFRQLAFGLYVPIPMRRVCYQALKLSKVASRDLRSGCLRLVLSGPVPRLV